MTSLLRITIYHVLSNHAGQSIIIKELKSLEVAEIVNFLSNENWNTWNFQDYHDIQDITNVEVKVFTDPVIINSIKTFFEFQDFYSTIDYQFFDMLRFRIKYKKYNKYLDYILKKCSVEHFRMNLYDTLGEYSEAIGCEGAEMQYHRILDSIGEHIESLLCYALTDHLNLKLQKVPNYDPNISILIKSYLIEDDLAADFQELALE